jgi:hypothetical protein
MFVLDAQLDADQRGLGAFGAEPRVMDGVDDGRVAMLKARRPAEDRDLDPEGLEPEVQAQRGEQRIGPRSGDQHHRRSRDPALRRLDADDAAALDHDAPRFAVGVNLGAVPPRGLGIREGRRVGIGEAGVRLPGGRPHVLHPTAGQQARQLLERQHLGRDSQPALHGHVVGERPFVASAHELHEAHRLEAALAAHHGFEIPEDLEAFPGQARFGFVGVVHPDERARLAAGAGRELPALEEHDAPDAEAGQMKGRAGAVDPAPDDDDVRAAHGCILTCLARP